MNDLRTAEQKWACLVHACLRGGLAIRYRGESERFMRSEDHSDQRLSAIFRNWSRVRAARTRLH